MFWCKIQFINHNSSDCLFLFMSLFADNNHINVTSIWIACIWNWAENFFTSSFDIFKARRMTFFPAPGYKLLQLQFIPMIVQKTKKPWRTNKYQILLHNLRFMSCTTSLHEDEIGVKRNLLFLYMDIRCNFLFKMVSYDESFAWRVFIKKTRYK